MRIIILFLISFLTCSAFAGNLDKIILKLSNVSTSSTPSEMTVDKITGWYERADIFFEATTNSCDIDIISSNKLSGVQTTLYSVDGKTNSSRLSFNLRASIHDSAGNVISTNSGERISAYDEKIYFRIANSLFTNKYVEAIVIYERP